MATKTTIKQLSTEELAEEIKFLAACSSHISVEGLFALIKAGTDGLQASFEELVEAVNYLVRKGKAKIWVTLEQRDSSNKAEPLISFRLIPL